MDPGLNELLKWGIENSSSSRDDPSAQKPESTTTGLNQEILAQLMGGPSDADRMKEAIAAVQSPDLDLDNKLIAFDNFEQLVENIDNANNMEALGLWVPLVQLLTSEEGDLRMMAAWCIGTAVQNNIKAQERLHAVGAIPTLVKMAVDDGVQTARKKAILALSSGVRNYQPSLDVALKNLPAEYKMQEPVDAEDMEKVDAIIQKLRDQSAQKG